MVVGTTPVRLDEPFTINTDGLIDLTTAYSIEATLGGVPLSGMVVVDATHVVFDSVSAGLLLDTYHDLVVSVDTTVGDPHSVILLPPTGFLSVVLAGIDPASWLNKPVYLTNPGGEKNNIGANDQLVYQSTTSEAGIDVIIDAMALPSMPTAPASTPDQTISWFYLDAQDSYNRGGTQVLTLTTSNGVSMFTEPFSVTVMPPTGKQAVQLGVIADTSIFFGVRTLGDIILFDTYTSPGGYLTTLTTGGLFSLTGVGNDQTTQTINYAGLDSTNSLTYLPEAVLTIELGDSSISLAKPIPTGVINLGNNAVYELSQFVDNPQNLPLIYSIESGRLNPGMKLNPLTGRITVLNPSEAMIANPIEISVKVRGS